MRTSTFILIVAWYCSTIATNTNGGPNSSPPGAPGSYSSRGGTGDQGEWNYTHQGNPGYESWGAHSNVNQNSRNYNDGGNAPHSSTGFPVSSYPESNNNQESGSVAYHGTAGQHYGSHDNRGTTYNRGHSGGFDSHYDTSAQHMVSASSNEAVSQGASAAGYVQSSSMEGSSSFSSNSLQNRVTDNRQSLQSTQSVGTSSASYSTYTREDRLSLEESITNRLMNAMRAEGLGVSDNRDFTRRGNTNVRTSSSQRFPQWGGYVQHTSSNSYVAPEDLVGPGNTHNWNPTASNLPVAPPAFVMSRSAFERDNGFSQSNQGWGVDSSYGYANQASAGSADAPSQYESYGDSYRDGATTPQNANPVYANTPQPTTSATTSDITYSEAPRGHYRGSEGAARWTAQEWEQWEWDQQRQTRANGGTGSDKRQGKKRRADGTIKTRGVTLTPMRPKGPQHAPPTTPPAKVPAKTRPKQITPKTPTTAVPPKVSPKVVPPPPKAPGIVGTSKATVVSPKVITKMVPAKAAMTSPKVITKMVPAKAIAKVSQPKDVAKAKTVPSQPPETRTKASVTPKDPNRRYVRDAAGRKSIKNPGDWWCSFCSELNYVGKTRCHKCPYGRVPNRLRQFARERARQEGRSLSPPPPESGSDDEHGQYDIRMWCCCPVPSSADSVSQSTSQSTVPQNPGESNSTQVSVSVAGDGTGDTILHSDAPTRAETEDVVSNFEGHTNVGPGENTSLEIQDSAEESIFGKPEDAVSGEATGPPSGVATGPQLSTTSIENSPPQPDDAYVEEVTRTLRLNESDSSQTSPNKSVSTSTSHMSSPHQESSKEKGEAFGSGQNRREWTVESVPEEESSQGNDAASEKIEVNTLVDTSLPEDFSQHPDASSSAAEDTQDEDTEERPTMHADFHEEAQRNRSTWCEIVRTSPKKPSKKGKGNSKSSW